MNPKKGTLMSFLSHCLYLSIGLFAGFVIAFLYCLWKGVKEKLEASRTESPAEAEGVQPSVLTDELQAEPRSEPLGEAYHRIVEGGDPRHPTCLAVGHKWDDPEWERYSEPLTVAQWSIGGWPEYRQDQRCTREGCGAYRLRLKEGENGKPKVVILQNNKISAESEEGESHVSPA